MKDKTLKQFISNEDQKAEETKEFMVFVKEKTKEFMELNTRGSVKFIKNLRKSTQVNRITHSSSKHKCFCFFLYLPNEIV